LGGDLMDAKRQREIESRIQEISRELGLLEPNDLISGRPAAEHDLEEIEELYSERERLIQELELDC
jgi:hypothetical protein